jgi:hypothetical protein
MRDLDRICLMAGNIAGPMTQVVIETLSNLGEDIPDDFEELVAEKSVKLALEIQKEAYRKLLGEEEE